MHDSFFDQIMHDSDPLRGETVPSYEMGHGKQKGGIKEEPGAKSTRIG